MSTQSDWDWLKEVEDRFVNAHGTSGAFGEPAEMLDPWSLEALSSLELALQNPNHPSALTREEFDAVKGDFDLLRDARDAMEDSEGGGTFRDFLSCVREYGKGIALEHGGVLPRLRDASDTPLGASGAAEVEAMLEALRHLLPAHGLTVRTATDGLRVQNLSTPEGPGPAVSFGWLARCSGRDWRPEAVATAVLGCGFDLDRAEAALQGGVTGPLLDGAL